MARWDLPLAIERASGVPLFQQIARAIAADIRRGRLRPGDRLPGTRTLARSLGVQRQTVVVAFDELLAEGWIVTEPARGAFVSRELPDPAPRRFAPDARPAAALASRVPYALPAGPPLNVPYAASPGTLLAAPSRVDVRLTPGDLIGRAYRRAVRKNGGALLTYGSPEGHIRLRRAVAAMLAATRGIAAREEHVCITRGSQMALYLAARALVRPGDLVAVEDVGYRPAWEVFRLAGASLAGVPVDREGLRTDRLEALMARRAVRAVYVTPHHQFPTTVTMSAGRRLKLLALARAHGCAVVEDDYDHEFHYDGRPVLPLASADLHGSVVYLGTLSKVLAPTVRTGYIVGPVPLVRAIAAYRSYVDAQGDQALEYALAELMEDGEIQRHIRRVRREYAARRAVLVESLARTLGEALSFDVPAGGVALWAKVAPDLDADAWVTRARAGGVMVEPGSAYTLDGTSAPFLHLGFAPLDRSELVEAVRRLAAARPTAAVNAPSRAPASPGSRQSRRR